MWSSKKKKGITPSPGRSIEIEFTTTWRHGEVVIMTDKGRPITLNEKSEFFIELSADNINPIKIQIIPDFKNRVLNCIEIIDPNVQLTDENKGSIKFVGINISKKKPISLGEYLKKWDENLEEFGKNIKIYKKRKYIYTILLIVLIFLNTYLFINESRQYLRYFNIFTIIISICTLYYLWKTNRELLKEYEEYKELREKSFGIVKEK